jgi:hypothetical protein
MLVSAAPEAAHHQHFIARFQIEPLPRLLRNWWRGDKFTFKMKGFSSDLL